MKHHTSVGENRVRTELERLRAEDERSRRRRIVLLRRELGRIREMAKRLEEELRLLGDRGATRGRGTDWNAVYERLGATFTAMEMGEMTGARAGLVASIVHRWRAQGRIVSIRRGTFRKMGGRR